MNWCSWHICWSRHIRRNGGSDIRVSWSILWRRGHSISIRLLRATARHVVCCGGVNVEYGGQYATSDVQSGSGGLIERNQPDPGYMMETKSATRENPL